MSSQPAQSAPAVSPIEGAPAWNTLAHEVRCPLCDYNLRGLTKPLCPECGYRFEWRILLDENLNLHPYLFEHHPERNASSFVDTLLGGFRPKRFWSALKPQQPSSLRRLMIYATTCIAIMAIGTIAIALAAEPNAGSFLFVLRSLTWHALLPRFEAFDRRIWLYALWLHCMSYEKFYRFALPLSILAWPGVTFMALLLFAQSMGRAKVKRIHVLRCVVYSSDIMVTAAIASMAFAAGVQILLDFVPMHGNRDQAALLLVGAIAFWIIASWRLFRAYQLYLRFHRPFLTILASQMIVFLVFLFVMTRIWPPYW